MNRNYARYLLRKMGCLETFIILNLSFEIRGPEYGLDRIRIKASMHTSNNRESLFAVKIYNIMISKLKRL